MIDKEAACKNDQPADYRGAITIAGHNESRKGRQAIFQDGQFATYLSGGYAGFLILSCLILQSSSFGGSSLLS